MKRGPTKDLLPGSEIDRKTVDMPQPSLSEEREDPETGCETADKDKQRLPSQYSASYNTTIVYDSWNRGREMRLILDNGSKTDLVGTSYVRDKDDSGRSTSRILRSTIRHPQAY